MSSSYSRWEGGDWLQVIDGVIRRREARSDGICRSWHANGVLASEYTRVNGVNHGTYLEWHDNGVLAKQSYILSGRVHGVVRQWNRDGKLLGEYSLCEGCGVKRVWNEDGSLQKEYEQLSKNAARGKIWDDLGQAREVFLWNGKAIPKARWLKKIEEVGESET